MTEERTDRVALINPVRGEAHWDEHPDPAQRGLPVRAIADDALGLYAVAAGPRESPQRALEALVGAPPGDPLPALRAAFSAIPEAVEVTALVFRADGAVVAHRGTHRAYALQEGRLLALTPDQTVAEEPGALFHTGRSAFRWEFTPDLAAAWASRAALSAEQLGLLRQVPGPRALELRALEASPGTRYVILSHTAHRALGHDVVWQLAKDGAGARALVDAARIAYPAQRRGAAAVVAQVTAKG
jgi:hypothetical protein